MRMLGVLSRLLVMLAWLGLAAPAWADGADSTPPAPPLILGVSAPGLWCADAQPDDWPGVEVMGVAEPRARLQLWLRGPADVVLEPVAWFHADAAGHWLQEIMPLEPGWYALQAAARDAAGNWAWGQELQVEISAGQFTEVVALQAGAEDDDAGDSLTYYSANVADAWLCAWSPQCNYGADTRLRVRYGAERSSLLRFDLATLPSGVRIERAALALYCTARSNSNPLMVEAYRVRSAWVDAEATCARSRADCYWQSAGANGPDDRDLTPAAAISVAHDRSWYALDVTDLARAWYADPASNQGVLLKGAPNVAVQYDLASSEYPDPRLRPMLWLTLSPEIPSVD